VLDVTVTNTQGKVVHKGKTDAKGGFVTPKLPAGDYVVQLQSRNPAIKTARYALRASAGKKRVDANAVSGKEFLGGGVGMKIAVADGLNITGAITDVNVAGGTGDTKVKIINGKRYVWMSSGGTGSNLGGRWVEEGTENSFNRNYITPDAFHRQRDGHGHIDQGVGGGRQ